MTHYILFVVAMLAQVIVGRTQLLAARGYIRDTSGIFASLVGIVAGIAFFALVVWGFASLPWYFVLPTTLAMGAVSGFIVDLKSFPLWYRTRTVVDLIAVALTGFLWLTYWPF